MKQQQKAASIWPDGHTPVLRFKIDKLKPILWWMMKIMITSQISMEWCTQMAYTYFPHAIFVALYVSLVLMFISCKYKHIIEEPQ
jgi:hypothetical protein